jgi:hypothetical protein
MPIPNELEHLRNIIEGAKRNDDVELLRDVVKSAADEAPPKDIILMAEFILKRGIEIHEGQTN